LKYLKERSPEKARALQVLALALYFDEDLFRHLVQQHYIEGIPIQGLVSELLANRSYVRRFDDGGHVSYRFHRHMQLTLFDDLEKEPEAIEAARRSIDAILEYYAGRSFFTTPAEFAAGTHLPAYEHGMDILLTHSEHGWISSERMQDWFDRFEESFDEHTATASRARVCERALTI